MADAAGQIYVALISVYQIRSLAILQKDERGSIEFRRERRRIRLSEFAGLSAMVVDDNLHMCMLVKTVLQTFGFESVRAADGVADAIRNLEDHPIDIIITDWNMEPLDGLELVRMLRSGEAGVDHGIPIIMLSGHAEMELARAARDMGVDEFLAKPISAESLHACLVSVIQNARKLATNRSYSRVDLCQRNSAPEGGPADPREGPSEETNVPSRG